MDLIPIAGCGCQFKVLFLLRGVILWSGLEACGSRTFDKLCMHIHALPIQFFTGSRVGELMTRISSDTGLLMALVTNVIGDLMKDPLH